MDVETGDDGVPRCAWSAMTPQMQTYHDTEWGFPVQGDQQLFEKLCLEAFQSGLSWRTILEKRESFRAAFDGFNPKKIAAYTDADVARLMGDAGIVRNRLKIHATIHNARLAAAMAPGELAELVWSFEPPRRVPAGLVSSTPQSTAFAKELNSRGWKFVGPTTAHAFMQAMGIVNDHLPGCHVRDAAEAARHAMGPP